MATLSHSELAAELADDTEEYRMELQVDHVSPRYLVPSAAFVPVRAGCEREVEAAHAALSDALRNVLHLHDAANLHGRDGASWYAGLPTTGKLVEIGHHSDRAYAGYGNLFRAIGAFAQWLGDARFFISEDYSTFVDEYRIRDGVLQVERGYAEEEYRDAKHAYYVAAARTGDRELSEFVAWQLAVTASYSIPDRADYTSKRDPSDELATAYELDPDSHEVLFQRGRAARAAGDDTAATEWFTRALAVDDPRIAVRLVTMAATAIAAGKHDLAQQWLARAPNDRVVALLRGRVDDLAPVLGDREAIPWTRDAEARLAAYVKRIRELDLDRAAAAREVYGWAELYRIRTAHDVDKVRSRRIADALFDAALALDPLGGDIAAHRVFHDHGFRGDAATAAFLAVLDEFPTQGDALFWAASALHGAQRWSEAAAIGRRYLAAGAKRGSYERGAGATVLSDSLVRDAYERMMRGELGAETEKAIDDAIAIADPHGSWEGPWLGKADLYEYRRDHAAALPLYDDALARKPDSPHALSGKASCLLNLGRFADALACVTEAFENDDTYWHAYYVKACVLARTGGDRDEIIALARKALELEPAKRAQIVDEPDLAAVRDALVDVRDVRDVKDP
ncbi:MAG TPA: tetratricopeptide repeat protein [Kofleriaceae bacterium]